MEGKGREIARCLGYRRAFDNEDAKKNGNIVGDSNGVVDSIETYDASMDSIGDRDYVDMWHLRSLAIRPGGLLNSHGRKLGWIKLAGVDDALAFNSSSVRSSSSGKERGADAPRYGDDDDDVHATYEQIQEQLDGEMGPSRWHIQRERRRLRKSKHNGSTAPSSAASTNDLSSIDGSERSDSSTPLTANLNSRAGTPKLVTFTELDGGGPPMGVHPASAAAASLRGGAPFTTFSTKRRVGDSSPSTSYASCPSTAVDTTFDINSLVDTSLDANNPTPKKDAALTLFSPLSLASPTSAAPQCPNAQPSPKFQLNLTPKSFLQYSQKYQRKADQSRAKKKKDCRPQERKYLVQIAASAFYLLKCQRRDESKLRFYPGMQDLIAVLLFHLESPSLTSLVLKQIVESHLWVYCSADDGGDDDCNASFATCMDEVAGGASTSEEDGDYDCDSDDSAESSSCDQKLDLLSLSFFPMLQILDKEMHASLARMDLGRDFIKYQASVFGEVLRKWISSWFCCHDTLPLEVVSRVVDFFLASHPSMPLYISLAILCHPLNRVKLLALSRQQTRIPLPKPQVSGDPHLHNESSLHPPQTPPQDINISVATILENIFTNLSQELFSQGGFVKDGKIGEFGTCASKDNDVEWGNDDNNELVIGFFEQAISTAISFMKQIPPQEIFPLVKKYRNGVLLSYLCPREQETAASPLLRIRRSAAPTDYSMIHRKFADNAAKQSATPWRTVAEKHQIALDASGFPLNQLMPQSRTQEYWSTITKKRATPTKAVIVGIVLCIGAQHLQMKQNPLFDNKMMMLSEKSSHNLKLTMPIGLQSLLAQFKQSMTPGALDRDVDTIKTTLSSLSDNDTVTIPEMPSLYTDDAADALVEKTLVAQTALGSSLSSGNQPISTHGTPSPTSEDNEGKPSDETNSADSKDALFPVEIDEGSNKLEPSEDSSLLSDSDPYASHEVLSSTLENNQDKSDETNGADSKDKLFPEELDESCNTRDPEEDPISLPDSDYYSSYEIPSYTLENNQDKLSDEAAGVDSKGAQLLQSESDGSFHTSESKQKDRHLKPRAERAIGLIHFRVRNYTRRSRKTGAGIKKRAIRSLKGFRDGYIALVENDNFFL